ncbi:hypothetical protein BD626DRAFT_23183 [Schizophyllum amplum]|uniref:Uncharacterized protein n=1 Tax=Schizophyllum amplum TaxID=97359 RepID=A0A550CZ71_9AGAR|nr:hypothetical protein BD626DRAFT_23183 [Auriculariopsis ampla]
MNSRILTFILAAMAVARAHSAPVSSVSFDGAVTSGSGMALMPSGSAGFAPCGPPPSGTGAPSFAMPSPSAVARRQEDGFASFSGAMPSGSAFPDGDMGLCGASPNGGAGFPSVGPSGFPSGGAAPTGAASASFAEPSASTMSAFMRRQASASASGPWAQCRH